MFFMLIICSCDKFDEWNASVSISCKIRCVLKIPETAWRRRESPPGDTCAKTQILGFHMNRLAAEGIPPGDTNCVAQIFSGFWRFIGVMMFGLNFHGAYMIGMMNYD